MSLVNLQNRHPDTVAILRWLDSSHLPERLQAVARPIETLGYDLTQNIPDDPELLAGLRKLVEAKDCLVRAAIRAHERAIGRP